MQPYIAYFLIRHASRMLTSKISNVENFMLVNGNRWLILSSVTIEIHYINKLKIHHLSHSVAFFSLVNLSNYTPNALPFLVT